MNFDTIPEVSPSFSNRFYQHQMATSQTGQGQVHYLVLFV
jgi:hypothetical protein